jgi:BirA family biotin operon repressor/biotin-[acetyl-CoA-carboxylase] ligase
MELTEEHITSNLGTTIFGRRIISFKSIKSTMDYAKSLAERDEPEGTVVIADYQSKGRGRFGRVWMSEPGKNILMSIIIRPSIPLEKFGLISFLSAVSVAEAIEKIANVKVNTKWPNDLLINGRKVSGILMEASITADKGDFVILGIGVNVNQEEFPKEIKNYATSLLIETGKYYDRVVLLQEILRSLESNYLKINQTHDFTEIMKKWKEKCSMLGKEITLIHAGKTINGTAVDVDSKGFLRLKVGESTISLSSGEVTIVK